MFFLRSVNKEMDDAHDDADQNAYLRQEGDD